MVQFIYLVNIYLLCDFYILCILFFYELIIQYVYLYYVEEIRYSLRMRGLERV